MHDWNDKDSIEILSKISENMSENSSLFVFETLVPEKDEDKGVTLSFHLLNFLGGRERKKEEFYKLFTSANLEIVNLFAENELVSIFKLKQKF
ncbi:O-methyltransferase [Thiovulum sp. ES]|nr:O-methyltransferase [Thiovulum sp. ES]